MEFKHSNFKAISDNKLHNRIISDYYKMLESEYPNQKEVLENRRLRLEDCQSFFLVDVYRKLKIKDIKKINLCKDRFCSNCKKVKQSVMMAKYYDFVMSRENLYHLVLTVPNVPGDELKFTIKHMAKCFYYLNRYLKGTKKIKGLNFNSFGYLGCLRSLEVTYFNQSYHPHYHVLLDFSNLSLDKFNKNIYSYSFGDFKRLFSDFEILIQKIWYLLFNNIKVTKSAVDNLDLGYSCIMDKVDDNSFLEVFKYAFKNVDDYNVLMSYYDFKVLFFSLYRVKQIQGYGCFYNVKDDINLLDISDKYTEFVDKMQEQDTPIKNVLFDLQSCIDDDEYKYISKFSFVKEYSKFLSEND